MDGLSTDSTLEIVKYFNDDRIKIFSEKDEGIYDAMNKGIDRANGEWLYFLGSDDVLYDAEVLSDISSFIKEDDGVSFIYGNVVMKKSNDIYAGEFDRVKLFYQNISHQAIFYKKDIFALIGLFDLKYKVWADWDLNLRCFLHPNILVRYIDRIIANYDDISGFSAIVKTDDVLIKERAVFYIEETRIKWQQSREYRIGTIVVKILRFIKKPYNFIKSI
ncbi:hypothetical protein AGMMS50262_05420 [Bacteroidia bacterium]|nr:hypothetical protein AGMMS50262_05420 [Bacteroidia bacterium]